MRVLVVGAGAVGSVMAMKLAQSGRDVWLVARGQRLAELSDEPVIVARHLVTGKVSKTRIHVLSDRRVPPIPAWDLVIVAVQAHQLEGAMVIVDHVAASRVLFMMNIVGDLRELRQRVGPDRFLLGLPALLGEVRNGELNYAVLPGLLRFLQITTIGRLPDHSPIGVNRIQDTLEDAGIATSINQDMESWLLTHAAFMTPIMVAGLMSDVNQPLSWNTSLRVARGILEGLDLVHRSGHLITPLNMTLVSLLPSHALAAGLWASFKLRLVRVASQAHITHAQGEVRHLIDALLKLDPKGRAKTLIEFSQLLDQMARTEASESSADLKKQA